MAAATRLFTSLGLREGERRAAAVAFAALFFTMLGHAALETARDALFLEALPPERLPLVYLGVAIVALGVGRLSLALKQRAGPSALPITLLGGAAVTLVFWLWVRAGGDVARVALYVWVGVFAMAATTQLWLHISEVLHVGQAKRVYGFVGAGGLLGAFAGAAGAALALMWAGTAALLPIAALAFVLAGAIGSRLARPEAASTPEPARAAPAEAPTRERRYARRLALSVFVAAALFTLVDLAFKTSVATHVATEELGGYFARVYAALDLAALVVQLWLAPRLLRTFGVHWTAALLPALLLTSGLGLLLFGGLAAALLGKGADGVLRHGLHKTSTEILYLPLSNATRARLKTFTEVLAQRAGQAIAAGVSLGATALGLPLAGAGLLVAALAGLWIFVLRGLERDYLGLFRRHLRRGAQDADVPQLDLGTLEVLIMALSAEDDQEVIGALDWLEAYDKAHLVPALILLHPARQVTLRAFGLFDAHPRPDALRVARRRCHDPDPAVRAAAIHLVARHGDDERALATALEDDNPAVRAEGLVILLRRGRITPEAAAEGLEEIVARSAAADADDRDLTDGLLVVARAFAAPPGPELAGAGGVSFLQLACRLAASEHPEVVAELATALGQNDAPEYIEPLIRLLSHRSSRVAAQRALVTRGAPARAALVAALDRAALPWAVRRRIPETLAQIPGPESARALLTWLDGDHPDRAVRAAIRALSHLRARTPDLALDDEALLTLARRWLQRAVTFLHAHVAVRCILKRQPRARTATTELLVAVLREKEAFGIEQAFLLLHTRAPQSGFRSMHEVLTQPDPRARASARELLTHLLPSDLRVGIDALTDDVEDRARLEAAVSFFDPPTRGRLKALEPALDGASPGQLEATARRAYEELLGAMTNEPSELLRGLIRFHRSEIEAADGAPLPHSELATHAASALRTPTEDLTHAWR